MSKLSEKCQSMSSPSSGGKSLGVQKFCSKLRHKIEDNLNSTRFANKLCKSSRHSMSMCALSGLAEVATGKYTNKTTKSMHNETQKSGMLKHKLVVTRSTQQLPNETETLKAENQIVASSNATSFAGTYVDSDDEYQLPSFSWMNQSLEDEIFEELEKVAHDESKLNTVLKSFDRILTDFHDDVDPSKSHKESVNPPTAPLALEAVPPVLQKSLSNMCEVYKKPTSKLNKSVLDISTPCTSKIPVWKALPLSKRSKSFCNAPTNELLAVTTPEKATDVSKSLRNRAVSYMTIPRQKAQPQRVQIKTNKSTECRSRLIKSKTELNVKTKLQNRSKTHTPLQSTIQKQIPGNLRRSHTNSDELLDKCLEKGQQILRKIETLNVQGVRLKCSAPAITKKPTTTTTTTTTTAMNGIKSKKKIGK